MNSEVFLNKVHNFQLAATKNNCSGTLLDMIEHHYQAAGKMLRPLFGLKVAICFGADPQEIIPWCSACEMLHNSTLIHDDLQDGDTKRRSHPTVWKIFGANQAINAGDFLLALAPKLIQSTPVSDSVKLKLMEEFSTTASKIVEGQSIEFTLSKKVQDTNIEELYLKCIEYKTSQLFSGITKGVGLIANLNESQVNNIETSFRELGSIFQIQDDLLDLFGDKQRGSSGNDIKEGKISSLVVSYLKIYPKDELNVLDIILKPREDTTDEDVEYVISTFKTRGPLSASLETLASKIDTIKSLTIVKENDSFKKLLLESVMKTLSPIQHLFKNSDVLEEQTWTT